MKRTNYCGLISKDHIGQHVVVQGWISKIRNMGKVIFIDLRDREGILQVIIELDNKYFAKIEELKNEYVVEITGFIRKRLHINSEVKNGDIELILEDFTLLNTAKNMPILIDDKLTNEMSRMSSRILDLRSQRMQYNIRTRCTITREIRNFLDNNGFLDIETPFLTLSTPGGARDFLVPSRMNKGKFYALPQSPQIFKQLYMIAGFDRYYQIVRCFRDEELRSDRQPEFTQVDIETSFINEQQIRELCENLIIQVFKKVLNIDLPKFPIITYQDAMFYYGSDKPDLRIPLKFIELTSIFKYSSFEAFNVVANSIDGRIAALRIPVSVSLSRKDIDQLSKFVNDYNAKALTVVKVINKDLLSEEGIKSPILKFLSQQELSLILELSQVQNNETLLIIADKKKIVENSLGVLRLKIGHHYNLYETKWAPLWVIDFPMFEFDEEKNCYLPAHHAFTAPKYEHIQYLLTEPKKCLAQAYDMVLNGSEIGGGSVRIHNSETQKKVFNSLNLSEEDAIKKFGYLLDNLQYGAPPHGGLAFGLDRLTAIMCEADSIRDVIPLPKTTTGQCLLTNAPSTIEKDQLHELGISI